MPTGGKPTVRSRRLGTTLKRLRLTAELDQEQAADAVGCSAAKISRIESGTVSARVGDVRILLDLYGVSDGDERQRLEQLARDSNKRGWWLDYRAPSLTQLGHFIALESEATYIRTWHPTLVPGLLQVPEYTKVLTDANPTVITDEAADDIIKVRQGRQRMFEERGTRFAAVIWEPALTSPMPSSNVQRQQLSYIAKIAERPNVTVQVLPTSEWAAARISPQFLTLSFEEESAPEAVALESLSDTMILEDPADLANYTYAFEALRSAALTPDQSLAFIRNTMNNLS